MLRVGLTGGLASGKSTVGAMMQAQGAHLLKADELAHQLMSPGRPVYEAVLKHFGQDIVQQDGSIDRKLLAEEAFGGGRVAELNALVHPAVVAEQRRWMDQMEAADPGGIAVVEAALILEAGAGKDFDRVVVVAAADTVKVQRFVERSLGTLAEAVARSEAERRLKAQWPEAKKMAAADRVIRNDGTLAELEIKVNELMKELKRDAAQMQPPRER